MSEIADVQIERWPVDRLIPSPRNARAGWDVELLHLELKDLSNLGADLSHLGFTEKELAVALKSSGTSGLTDEDEIPKFVAGRPSPAEPRRLPTGSRSQSSQSNDRRQEPPHERTPAEADEIEGADWQSW